MAIYAISYLLNKNAEIKNVYIVSPKSIINQFVEEIKKFTDISVARYKDLNFNTAIIKVITYNRLTTLNIQRCDIIVFLTFILIVLLQNKHLAII